MQNNRFFFPQDIYTEHLSIIKGVNFTRREIDIIACFVNARGTHKTASLLSIAPNTVLSHARNIMGKIECHTRDRIIDFIERSDKLSVLREHYISLTIEAEFINSLKSILKLKYEKNWTEGLIYWQDIDLKDALMKRLVRHLQYAGIAAIVKEQKKGSLSEITRIPDKLLLIFVEKPVIQKIPHQLAGFFVITLREEKNYYFAVFEILRKLLSHASLESIFKEFLELYKNIEDFSKGMSFCSYRNEILEKNAIENFNKIKILKNKKLDIAFLIYFVSLFFFVILLLHSEEIIQIEEKFKREKDIQVLPLMVPGGAGKTIVARHYPYQQKARVIGEINAEPHESPSSSFEDLEQTLVTTEDEPVRNDLNMALVLAHLGEIYRVLNEYDKVKSYRQNLAEIHIVLAEILVYLGIVYKDLGDYKKAKDLLEQSLSIYDKNFFKDHRKIAWALAHLGDAHRAMGNYGNAKALLEHSLQIYNKNFLENHKEIVWASECLKNVSQEMCIHGQNKNFLE